MTGDVGGIGGPCNRSGRRDAGFSDLAEGCPVQGARRWHPATCGRGACLCPNPHTATKRRLRVSFWTDKSKPTQLNLLSGTSLRLVRLGA